MKNLPRIAANFSAFAGADVKGSAVILRKFVCGGYDANRCNWKLRVGKGDRLFDL